MDFKKWLPAIAIGAVVLFIISRLKGSGSSAPNVYNSLVPSGGGKLPDSRDPARVSAYSTLAGVGLGQLNLAEKSKELDVSAGLARDRFAYQLQALGSQIWNSEELARINNEGSLQRLQAELADRNYDRELQQRALDQTFALAQSGQIGNQLGSTIQALLNALGRGRQQAQNSRGGQSGGTGGTPTQQQRRTVPQMSQAALNRLRQSALMQAIFGGSDPTAGYRTPPFNPQAYLGFSDPGGFWDNYGGNYSDLQQGLDWWANLNEPVGTVTSDFEYLDFFSGGVPQFDRSLPVYEPSYDEWYYDWGGWLYDDYS